MKFSLKYPLKTHLFAGIFIMASVVLGRWFAIAPLQSSIIWPALGFAFGFVLYYKKPIFPVLIVGYYLGYLISYIFFEDLSIGLLLFQPVLLVASSMIPIYAVLLLADKLAFKLSLDLVNISHFFLMTLALIVMTTILGHLSYLSTGALALSDVENSWYVWFFGDFFSVFIISVPLYFALHYDDEAMPIRFKKDELILYGVFLMFSILFIFGWIPFFNFDEHKYIFGVFAVYVGFKAPYRTSYIFSIFFILMLAFVQPFDTGRDHYALMLDINIFLSMMTLIVLLIKSYQKRILSDQSYMISTQNRLDNLVQAMHNLLRFSTDYRDIEGSKIRRQIKAMFETILTLYDKSDYASVTLIGKRVHFIDAKGYDVKQLNALQLSSEGWKLDLDKPVLIQDAERFIRKDLGDKYASCANISPKIKESLHLTIRLRDGVYCGMSFDFDEKSEATFSRDDLMFFESLQILFNSYYESEHLTAESDTIRNDIILSLLRTLELFDPYLSRHSIDVAMIAEAIAKLMKLAPSTVEQIYWSGIVHDIGKLGVEENVAKKQGKYSYADYEAMKKHVEYGYQVIQQSPVLDSVATFVYEHHERIDGSGYPRGLTENEISIGGQILGLAEIIATMASSKNYTPSYPKERIVEELKGVEGAHFSKAVIDAGIEAIHSERLSQLFKKNV